MQFTCLPTASAGYCQCFDSLIGLDTAAIDFRDESFPVSYPTSSGQRDLECDGVIGRFLGRQLDLESRGILSPLKFSLVA